MKRTPLQRKTPMTRLKALHAVGAHPGATQTARHRTSAQDQRWFAAVASIPACVLCGAPGVQVSHSNRMRGMGQKSAPWNTAALCPSCHHEIDNGPDMTQVERRALHYEAIVRTHDWLYRNERIPQP